MGGRVIQGFFVGGAMRAPAAAQPVQRAAPRAFAPGNAPGPPAPSFERTRILQRRPAPGPPPPLAGGSIARPAANGNSFAIDPVAIGLARGGGQGLPAPLLAKMEAAFQADFSAVRVHVGPQASRIGAVAFTTGNDIYFAPGRYQPDSVQGQQLIGHELAHVIQQRQGRVRAPGAGVAVVQDRALEAEADRLGMRAAMRPAIQAKSAMPARPSGKGCGCGGCAKPGPPAPAFGTRAAPFAGRRATVQRSSTEVIGPTSMLVHGKRKNPPRSASKKKKGMTDRELSKFFGSSSSSSSSKKDDCKGARPSKPTKGIWNGSSRPTWEDHAALQHGALCALCGAPATAMDHIEPFKSYITANADSVTVCDGTCHFCGITSVAASEAYSDLDNLRPLCTDCNSGKASKDKKDPGNAPDGLIPIGPCPNAPNGCGGGDCNADVCL